MLLLRCRPHVHLAWRPTSIRLGVQPRESRRTARCSAISTDAARSRATHSLRGEWQKRRGDGSNLVEGSVAETILRGIHSFSTPKDGLQLEVGRATMQLEREW